MIEKTSSDKQHIYIGTQGKIVSRKVSEHDHLLGRPEYANSISDKNALKNL